jgi:hypothetical protein
MLALDGLAALDHLARESVVNGLINDHALRNRIGLIRGMRPLDWEQQRRNQEEYEERAAVMQLYAAFESLLRRDAQWRGVWTIAHFHSMFNANAIRAQKGSFVRLSEWLGCWRAAVKTLDPHLAKTRYNPILHQLKATFRQDRNPLMHNDRAINPPLVRVTQQLTAAYSVLHELTDDFGACDE